MSEGDLKISQMPVVDATTADNVTAVKSGSNIQFNIGQILELAVTEITNPGATPSPASGEAIAASSDGSGNLMVILNALNQNQEGGIYAAGNAQPLQTDGANNLNVNINASDTVLAVAIQPSNNAILTETYFPNPVIGQFTVGETEIRLIPANGTQPIFGTIYNGGPTSIYIGGYGVTGATGFEIPSKTQFNIPGATSMPYEGIPGQAGLWAISETGTNTVSVWGSYQ